MAECNISKQVIGLKASQDAISGNPASEEQLKSLSENDRQGYMNGYNRSAKSIDLQLRDAGKGPLYLPFEFFAPSTILGSELTSKVDQIYESGGSTTNKLKAIQNLGNIYTNTVADWQKPYLQNYVSQRVAFLKASPEINTALQTTQNKIVNSLFSSWMKNNPVTSYLHVQTGLMRLMAADFDTGGQHALTGISSALKDLPSFNDIRKQGLLWGADDLINKVAVTTAESKYDDPQLKSNLISSVTYRYTPGDTPGYLTLNKSMGPGSPFALSRFYVRDFIDPVAQGINIGKWALGDKDALSTEKAKFAMRYLIGMGIMKSMVFGTAATMPSIMNLGIQGVFSLYSHFTGNPDAKLSDIYKKLDSILPTNLLYKTTGIDLTEHFSRGIPFMVAPSALLQMGKGFGNEITGIGKAWESGDMGKVGEHAMSMAADVLPAVWGVPQPLRDSNTLRLMRATGKAMGGEIDFSDIPKVWGSYYMGTSQKTIKEAKETLKEKS